MSISDLLEGFGLWNQSSADDTLTLNYLTCGTEMGCAGYDEFVRYAKRFFDEASAAVMKNKEGYTRVYLNSSRIALDRNGQVRGIYTPNGKPVAFFKPNFKSAGFFSPEEELQAFKQSGTIRQQS